MICDQWDVVVVPFPFTEKPGTKRRPALVLSNKAFNENGHTLLTMITTKAHRPWPGDTEIEEDSIAGLHTSCIVRLKAFTLDNRLILNKVGNLSLAHRQRVAEQVHRYIL